jgi:hypothetical protein
MDWQYASTGNGAFITIFAPDGSTCFLQGDDAVAFQECEEQTHDGYTIADLCREYADVCRKDGAA